jgi:hypothetical protein
MESKKQFGGNRGAASGTIYSQNPPTKHRVSHTTARYATNALSKAVCAACAADSILDPRELHQQDFISFLDRKMDYLDDVHKKGFGVSDIEGSDDKFIPVPMPEEHWMHVSLDDYIDYMLTPSTTSRGAVRLALEKSNELAEGTARLHEIAKVQVMLYAKCEGGVEAAAEEMFNDNSNQSMHTERRSWRDDVADIT